MKQENRLRRLEDRRTASTGTDGARRLCELLEELACRLTGSEDSARASPAVVAALVLREGRLATQSVLQRAETLAACPGPVGKLFDGIVGGLA